MSPWGLLTPNNLAAVGLAEVQKSDTGASSIPSGTSKQVLPANATLGNKVVLFIYPTSTAQTVSSVTSPIGTFTKVSGEASPAGFDLEWWVCSNVTGAADTITVNTTTGNWIAQATEFSGGVGTAETVTGNSTTSTNATQVVTPPADNSIVLVGALVDSTDFTGGPSSPWVNYSAGFFSLVNGVQPTYQITSSMTPVTAAWTNTSQGWVTAAMTLY